jgi:hypothetical protein
MACRRAVKTAYDEGVAQRYGKPARLASGRKYERERSMFPRLHNEVLSRRASKPQ